MMSSVFILSIGAAAGAVSRWLLTLLPWHAFPFVPATLAANWVGAFCIGIAAPLISDPHWKLLLITGFLGSLTTLSGLSLETVSLLQQHRFAAALLTVCLHVFGSFALTALGLWLAGLGK
ncbi:CrcB family protein [Neisseria lisongii]|uniref:Fluoride-specific ion channel FluC n=1 Tax=Neisseria lisongii TaxID=2912188 RepID=A0AAW5ACS2_9NEIS|nr:CrcB family protein [Neisseria lisongii]